GGRTRADVRGILRAPRTITILRRGSEGEIGRKRDQRAQRTQHLARRRDPGIPAGSVEASRGVAQGLEARRVDAGLLRSPGDVLHEPAQVPKLAHTSEAVAGHEAQGDEELSQHEMPRSTKGGDPRDRVASGAVRRDLLVLREGDVEDLVLPD